MGIIHQSNSNFTDEGEDQRYSTNLRQEAKKYHHSIWWSLLVYDISAYAANLIIRISILKIGES